MGQKTEMLPLGTYLAYLLVWYYYLQYMRRSARSSGGHLLPQVAFPLRSEESSFLPSFLLKQESTISHNFGGTATDTLLQAPLLPS